MFTAYDYFGLTGHIWLDTKIVKKTRRQYSMLLGKKEIAYWELEKQ